jgi:RNA polymerase sigma-70 factor, ECF subfamily
LEIEKLIRKCTQNNRKAQNQLFNSFSDRLYVIAYRYLNNRFGAEEVIGNAFLKIFQSLPNFKFDDEFKFIAWMKRIVINEALMEIRKIKQIPTFTNEFPEIVSTAESTDQMNYEELMTIIDSLPEGYKLVFKLYVIEGYNHTEVADILMISEGTSKSQLHKARFQIQQKLLKSEQNYE